MSDAQPPRPRPQTTGLLGWALGVVVAACLLTLWVTYSLVTYDVGAAEGSYWRIAIVGSLAVAVAGVAVRFVFVSPGEGSRQLRIGRRLLIVAAALTAAGVAALAFAPS